MSSQEQIEVTPRRFFFRNLSETLAVRLVLAVVFLGLCVLAGLAIWAGRDLFALLIIAALIIYGVRVVTDALPLSSKTRARLAEDERLDGLYPSHRYKFLLWLGIGVLLPKIWHYYQGKVVSADDLAVSFAFIVCGLLATIIWHFRHSKNERGA